MKRRIKLMADYGCWPLWHYSDEESGNIDPESLSLSEDLKTELASWASQFDSILSQDDPAASAWPSKDIQSQFVTKGRELATRLQAELGAGTEVVYFNDVTSSVEAL
jgi:hypothetical protein